MLLKNNVPAFLNHETRQNAIEKMTLQSLQAVNQVGDDSDENAIAEKDCSKSLRF